MFVDWAGQTVPIVDGVFTAIDRKTAAGFHREGVPLRDVERALLLGCARWHVTWLNRGRGAPIASFNYFLPILDEVRELAVSDGYWDHLKMRLPQLHRQRITRLLSACANFAQPNAPEGETR